MAEAISQSLSTSASFLESKIWIPSTLLNTDDDKVERPQFVLDENDETMNDEEIRCVTCENVLIRPISSSCGHLMCYNCFISLFENNDVRIPCPACAEELDENDWSWEYGPLRKLKSLLIVCSNKDEGCFAQIEWKNLVTHENECSFKKQPCPSGCKALLSIKDKDSHICKAKPTQCPECYIVLFPNELHHHMDNKCPKMKVNCPNMCGMDEIDRECLRNHLKSCSHRTVMCFYASIGCLFAGKEVDMKSHYETATHDHLYILHECLKSKDVLIFNLEEKLNLFEKEMQELKSSNLLLSETYQQNVALNEKINTLEARLSSKYCNNMNENSGILIWKYTDYSIRRTKAMRNEDIFVDSVSFYTHYFGYKVCARIYPSGDGSGRNSYLSAFFIILKGEHDDINEWPFIHKVSIMLLNQNNGRDHYCETFAPEFTSNSFQKPQNDRNIASGFPQYIQLGQLEKSHYLKNDSLYFKIVAGPGK